MMSGIISTLFMHFTHLCSDFYTFLGVYLYLLYMNFVFYLFCIFHYILFCSFCLLSFFIFRNLSQIFVNLLVFDRKQTAFDKKPMKKDECPFGIRLFSFYTKYLFIAIVTIFLLLPQLQRYRTLDIDLSGHSKNCLILF